eukprot:1387668-Ditylum_brightwellii.AAC.3
MPVSLKPVLSSCYIPWKNHVNIKDTWRGMMMMIKKMDKTLVLNVLANLKDVGAMQTACDLLCDMKEEFEENDDDNDEDNKRGL